MYIQTRWNMVGELNGLFFNPELTSLEEPSFGKIKSAKFTRSSRAAGG
jgi:hypothetical protein